MKAKDIEAALYRYYSNGCRYVVPNVYFFGHAYGETDFLVVKESNGWIYDIEVKISRGDFFADFKKVDKHSILEHAFYKSRHNTYRLDDNGAYISVSSGDNCNVKNRPNRFYYCVPTGLVKPEEVPHYAGLMYVDNNGTITKIREAKVLHKDKLEVESRLCRKFYYQAQEFRQYKENNGISKLKSQVTQRDREITDLQTRLREAQHELFTLKQGVL